MEGRAPPPAAGRLQCAGRGRYRSGRSGGELARDGGGYRFDVDLVVGRERERARGALVAAVLLAPRAAAERLCNRTDTGERAPPTARRGTARYTDWYALFSMRNR